MPETPDRMVFTADEFAMAVYLAARLDPAKHSSDVARAFIAKAKACVAADALPVFPVPTTGVRAAVRRHYSEIGF